MENKTFTKKENRVVVTRTGTVVTEHEYGLDFLVNQKKNIEADLVRVQASLDEVDELIREARRLGVVEVNPNVAIVAEEEIINNN